MEPATAHKRKTSTNKRTRHDDAYKCVSFMKRPESGRPRSPHRYFDDSFSVTFGHACAELESDEVSNGIGASAPTSASVHSSGTSSSKNAVRISDTTKHQIVHRHLNGLCLVTAGTILDEFRTDTSPTISVSSVEYHVSVSQGAQSARGKLRAKKSKCKSGKSSDAPDVEMIHNGTVQPNDALCTIRLSNGNAYEFQCCVAGTVLELNQRLVDTRDVNKDGEDRDNEGDADCKEAAPGRPPINPSLVLSDPLLDGYLAVILPKGRFPPNNNAT